MSSFDIINKSLQNSPLYQSLVSASKKDNFLYTIKPSPGIFAKSNTRVNSRVPPGFNRDISFLIPRQGLLSVAYIKLQLSGVVTAPAPNATYCVGGGLYFIHTHVDLCTKALVIERNYSDSIYTRINSLPNEIREGYLSACQNSASIPANTDLSTSPLGQIWIPLFFSFAERPENFLDTRFLENLEIKFKSCPNITNIIPGATVTNPGIAKCELVCNFINPILKEYQDLQAQQFTIGQPLSMLWNNQEKEQEITTSASVDDQAIEFTMNLSTKKLVHATQILVWNINSNGADFENIERVQFKAMGSIIRDVSGLELQIMLSRPWNRFGTKVDVSSNHDNTYTMYWGLTDDIIENSGAIAFASLNDPTLVVRARVKTAGTYQLNVVHNCWNIINCNGTTGEVTRSLDK